MGALIDFAARETHFLDHLAPVWLELPEDRRGRFYVTAAAAPRARALGLDPVIANGSLPAGDLIAVASVGDLRRAGRRPAVLLQHGAGQSYGGRHPSYPGGIGYKTVELFVNPNLSAANRNRRYYPRAAQAIVGCPKLDRWHLDPAAIAPPPSSRPTVAVSFHWPCRVALEAGSAFEDFGPELLDELVAHRDAGVIELLGHGHPRAMATLEHHYRRRGIPITATFDEVVERADLYIVDNSSTLYEFASLRRPVVVVNSPRYRRTVRHGLRFWEAAEVGPNVDTPAEVRSAVDLALAGGPDLEAKRRRAVAMAYAHTDGTASRRASLAIVDILNRRPASRCPICHARACSCGAPSEAHGITITRAEKGDGSPSVFHFGRGAHPQTRVAADFRLRPAAARALGVEPKGDALPPVLVRRLARLRVDAAPLAARYAGLDLEERRSVLVALAAADNVDLAATIDAVFGSLPDPSPLPREDASPDVEDDETDEELDEDPPEGRVGDVIAWVNRTDSDARRHARARRALDAEAASGKARPTLVAMLEKVLEE